MQVSTITGGRYELVSRILQSRDVEYFRARAEGLGGFEKQVLLKRVPDAPGNDAARKRLGREAVACSKLSFHAIAGVYDVYHEAGHLYLAMELVDGVGLDELMSLLRTSRSSLPLTAWMALAAQLLDAIDYIHKARDPVNGARLEIVHRDLSPDHIMVDRSGVLKLVGFGRCQVAGEEGEPLDRLTPWSPPELLSRSQASPASDLYSAACVLYELHTLEPLALESVLTGRPVTLSSAQVESRLALLRGEAEPLRAVLRRALAAQPQDRARSAGELVASLRAGKRTATASTPPNQVLRQLVERALEQRARELTDQGRPLDPPLGDVEPGAVIETIGWHPWRGDGSAPFRIDMDSFDEDLDPEDASLFEDPPVAEPAPPSPRPAKTVNLAEPEYTGEHRIPSMLEVSRDRSLLATSPGISVLSEETDVGDSTETQRSEPTGFDWAFSVPRMVARGASAPEGHRPGVLKAGALARPSQATKAESRADASVEARIEARVEPTDVRPRKAGPSAPAGASAPAGQDTVGYPAPPSDLGRPPPAPRSEKLQARAPRLPSLPMPGRALELPPDVVRVPPAQPQGMPPVQPQAVPHVMPQPMPQLMPQLMPQPMPHVMPQVDPALSLRPSEDPEPPTHVNVIPLWGGFARTPGLVERTDASAKVMSSALHELMPDRTLNGFPAGNQATGPAALASEPLLTKPQAHAGPVHEETSLLPPPAPLPEPSTRILELDSPEAPAASFGTHSETTCELTIDDLEPADGHSVRTSASVQAPAALLELIVLSQRAVVRVPLLGQGFNIGRSHRCDVVIVDDQVAPFHASLRHEDEGWMLRACPGESLHVGPHTIAQVRLTAGASCQLGPITLVVAPVASSPAPALSYERLCEELVREWPDLASQDVLLQEAGLRLSDTQRLLPPEKLWKELLEHFQNGADSRPLRRLLEVLSNHDPAEAWLQSALRTLRSLER